MSEPIKQEAPQAPPPENREAGGALAPTRPASGMQSIQEGGELLPIARQVIPEYISSIDPKDPNAQELVYRLLVAEAADAKELLNSEFGLVAMLCHVANVPTKIPGEYVQRPRTAFAIDDGRVFEFFSTTGLKCMMSLTLLHPFPWKAPILVKLKEKPSSNHEGGYYWLEKVFRNAAAKPADKKR